MTDIPQQQNQYQLSISGIVKYMALWALFFGVVGILGKYSSIGAKGSYSYQAGLVTDYGVPIALGLFFALIGIAVAFLIGRISKVRTFIIWSFSIGLFLLPATWIVLVILAVTGIIDLD